MICVIDPREGLKRLFPLAVVWMVPAPKAMGYANWFDYKSDGLSALWSYTNFYFSRNSIICFKALPR